MGEVTASRWDTPTGLFAWLMLAAFTALSSVMNVEYARLTESDVLFHGAIPVVVLVVGFFAELTFLSSSHNWAKRAVLAALLGCFAVVLVASYLGVRYTVNDRNPHAPEWVNNGLAAIPDVVMLAAATVLLSLRARRKSGDSGTKKTSRWGRIKDNMGQRVEQLTEPKASVEPSADPLRSPLETPVSAVMEPLTDPFAEALETPPPTSVEPSAEGFMEPLKTPAKVSAKPAPSTEPAAEEPLTEELLAAMDEAREMETADLVRRKTAIDYARIIAALDNGWSPTRIKNMHGYSHGTTEKVADFRAERRELEAVS
ncbi:hypothetical protein [Mycobacteroides abscessus]|uniref:hypothetical protein n=1 Tax=Mycobacteroides abscessus TaxID=36809 RepID=UPI0005E4567B|nr:hypothetical protein [Mycobacteroides abscessus]CPW94954.1 Uncharacterised protein [Mycobacteroides abscessus]SKU66981.1 Uncharacterised protein [Mycobacteroides abscessus subsp. abscessus]